MNGFGYVHKWQWQAHPHYRFCSMRCLDAGEALATRGGGMIDKTALEAQAIKAARHDLAETLNRLGLMPAFHDRTPADIDAIIEACIDGFQEAMQRAAAAQMPDDEIPF